MALVKFCIELERTFAIHSKPNQTKLNIFNNTNYLLPQMPNIVKTKTNNLSKEDQKMLATYVPSKILRPPRSSGWKVTLRRIVQLEIENIDTVMKYQNIAK